jgi:hypothetical protein
MAEESFEFFDPAEDCEWRTPREILARHGYEPIAPTELTDRQLSGRLWELLYAAAARRFFFYDTDHLSDRELYALLWDQWLDESTADIPPEAETNTNLPVSELNARGMTADEIWLRYYANDVDRVALAEPGESIPHEDPPFDRDRFLPTAPIPLEAHSGWLPADDEPEEKDDSDPLGLADIDREIAAAKTELPPAGTADSLLNEQLRASEPENWTPPVQQLGDENIPLLPPSEIIDDTLTPILWELLHNLALRGFYVLHTDHLSDRELYCELWERGLRDPAYLPGRNLRGGWFHDFLGSWGEDEMRLWLRFYGSDDERAKHAKDWPKDILPQKEKRPFNRDWRLPKGPF